MTPEGFLLGFFTASCAIIVLLTVMDWVGVL